MKNTIVVNLFGGQGTGKSTTMADLFAFFKHNGFDVEMCSEFAKELVWESRSDTFKDELYIFAKQNHRLFRCNGKVDIIVTDRPLLMSIPYNEVYGDKNNITWNKAYEELVINTFNQYNNINIFLNRVKPYNTNGRNETEDLAKEFDVKFKTLLHDFDIPHITVDADANAKNIIGEYIVNIIKKSEV